MFPRVSLWERKKAPSTIEHQVAELGSSTPKYGVRGNTALHGAVGSEHGCLREKMVTWNTSVIGLFVVWAFWVVGG